MSFTSSTENKWLQVSLSSRSFLKIRNRRGPNTKPWGTPLFTYLRSRGGRPISLEKLCSLSPDGGGFQSFRPFPNSSGPFCASTGLGGIPFVRLKTKIHSWITSYAPSAVVIKSTGTASCGSFTRAFEWFRQDQMPSMQRPGSKPSPLLKIHL